jgi:hypothetical protein
VVRLFHLQDRSAKVLGYTFDAAKKGIPLVVCILHFLESIVGIKRSYKVMETDLIRLHYLGEDACGRRDERDVLSESSELFRDIKRKGDIIDCNIHSGLRSLRISYRDAVRRC